MKQLLLIAILVSGLILAGCAKTGTDAVTGTAVRSQEIAEKPIEDTCFDSDKGINEEIAGGVIGTLNGQEFEFKDVCIRGHHVVEYYCEGTVYKNKNFVCQCMEGACHD